MDDHDPPEKRNYLRIQAELPVRYRFLRPGPSGPAPLDTCEGRSLNLSGGGLLLLGPIPDVHWVVDLLMEKIIVFVEVDLGGGDGPVRALARVSWLEGLDERTKTCRMGLKFKEITRDAQDRILNYIIESQLP